MPMIPSKRGRGRPTKLTKERAERAIELAASAQSQADIAAILGVTLSTLRHWLTEGRRFFEDRQDRGIAYPRGKKVWAEFSVDYDRAKALFLKSRLDCITLAGDEGEWKAAAWTAKVMDRERYGDQQKIDAVVSTNVVTLYPVQGDSTDSTLVLPLETT
jgi:hypothetical protein